MYTIIGIPV